MAYRGRRKPFREPIDERNYSSGNKFNGDAGRRLLHDEEYHNQNGLPNINKPQQQNTMEQSRLNPSGESRIPVTKRDRNRVPNTLREEQVTPVRERFRTRRQQELAQINNDTQNDTRRSKTNVSKRATFYRNGDKHFRGRTLIISKQRYRSFENLLEDLSKAVPLPYGVRNIFSPHGHLIESISDLEDGGYYICSSGDQLIRNIDYNSEKKQEKVNDGIPSDGIRNIHLSDPSDTSSSNSHVKTPKPRVFTISNEERGLKCKILLNRKTAKNYEDILRDISEMMKLHGEHVQELKSLKGMKVGGLSEMFHGDDVYKAVIAMGVNNKRNLSNPSSHSSNGDGLSPPIGRKQQKSRKKQRRDLMAQGVSVKVKGKKLTFFPPTKSRYQTKDEDNVRLSAPGSQPQLQWVYGYQGKHTHNNLHVLPSGELLYFVSRIVVIYNRQTNAQRHYTGHADDIKCVAVHPNQWYIATGQTSGLSLDQNELSHIRVWDSETLLTLTVLQLDDYSLSVVAMAFSVEDNGDLLSCIDSSGDSYRLNVWEWKDKKCLVQSKGFPSPVHAVIFDPDDNKTIISCGKEHIFFWRWHNGKLERKNGFFENNPVPQFVTCLDFAPNGDVYTGDSNGFITAWSKVSKKVKFVVRNAHEKSILCLHILDSGLLLTAGGVDGRICAWDANKYFSMPLHEMKLPVLTGISALEPLLSGQADDVTILVGTTDNCVIEGSFANPFTAIINGNKSEVPSFAVHPSRDLFVTASLDKTATLWSAVNHEIIWNVDLEFPVRVAAFYTTGSAIAFGTTQGRWIVINAESGIHHASFQDGTEQITDIEYSPDGEHIAIGSKDGSIYVHAVYDDGMTYRKVGSCSNHTSAVLFLDWSVDGCFIQSMSTEYEIITWEIGTFEREDSQNVIRDTEWNTRNVVLGYDVVGVWQSTPTEGNLVTSCDLAWSHDLLAIGDELGYIRIFRYPCCYEGAQYHQARAHSSTVLRVMFLSSDKFLLSTAGQDCAVLQWSMEGRMSPLTNRNNKKIPEQIQIEVSNPEDRQDIDEQEHDVNTSNKHNKKKRTRASDVMEDALGNLDNQTRRLQRLEELAKGVESQKSQNRDRSRNREEQVDSETSDDFVPDRTSDEYSSENPDRRQHSDDEQSRHGRRERPAHNRRSFEEDMYQDRDENSDGRGGRDLRRGRPRKIYEDDDESIDDDDNVVSRRRPAKPRQNGYHRDEVPGNTKNSRRRDVHENEAPVSASPSELDYDDEFEERNVRKTNRYGGKRDTHSDNQQDYYHRNKR